MDAISENTNRLTLRRLHAEYLVARDHPNPREVQERLDHIAKSELVAAIGAALTPLFSTGASSGGANAGGIWLIHRLHIAVDLNAGWEPERLAQVWARQIEEGLVATIQQGDSDNVLWFPNRAAFLARFLSDLAQGSGWDRWQYEEFAGLRPLPLSAALRTAICEQADVGLDALLQLSQAELQLLVQKLSLQDAQRILDRLCSQPSAGERERSIPASLWDALWSAWQRLKSDPLDDADEAKQTLQLFVAIRHSGPTAVASEVRVAAQALLRLARLLTQSPTAQARHLLDVISDGDLAALYSLLGAGTAERLGPLRDCPRELLQQMAKTLSGSQSSAASAPTRFAEARATAFGGAFLLLPLLDELPLAEATEGWSKAGDLTAITLIRFLLLVKCFGTASAARLFNEPLLRDLLKIPGPLGLADVAEWQRAIMARHRRHLLDVMLDWQRRRGAISDQLYGLARLTTTGAEEDGAPITLLFDGARGLWLSLNIRPTSHKRLKAQMAKAGHTPSLLICDPSWLTTLEDASLPLSVLAFDSEEAQALAAQDAHLNSLLARRDRLSDDLAFLSLPPNFGLSAALDHSLSVIAHSVLRALAWRLPGFALSSLPYLSANFLNFPATLEEEEQRWCVRSGKAPLHLVLAMSGLTRTDYRLSWFDSRPFQLYPESDS